uniref:Uncharacterized protein n=1 Tax=Glossina austeni TaxID=7395 RepID=A0A1A9V7A2_GLOAU
MENLGILFECHKLSNSKISSKYLFDHLIAQRPSPASLLPPAVNSGLLWSFADIYKIYENEESAYIDVVFHNTSQCIVSGNVTYANIQYKYSAKFTGVNAYAKPLKTVDLSNNTNTNNNTN